MTNQQFRTTRKAMAKVTHRQPDTTTGAGLQAMRSQFLQEQGIDPEYTSAEYLATMDAYRLGFLTWQRYRALRGLRRAGELSKAIGVPKAKALITEQRRHYVKT